jgi:hypothetical protein
MVIVGRARAELARAQAEAAAIDAAARARLEIAQNLPALAAAVGQRFGEVKITQIGGPGSALSGIAESVAAILNLARDA